MGHITCSYRKETKEHSASWILLRRETNQTQNDLSGNYCVDKEKYKMYLIPLYLHREMKRYKENLTRGERVGCRYLESTCMEGYIVDI